MCIKYITNTLYIYFFLIIFIYTTCSRYNWKYMWGHEIQFIDVFSPGHCFGCPRMRHWLGYWEKKKKNNVQAFTCGKKILARTTGRKNNYNIFQTSVREILQTLPCPPSAVGVFLAYESTIIKKKKKFLFLYSQCIPAQSPEYSVVTTPAIRSIPIVN